VLQGYAAVTQDNGEQKILEGGAFFFEALNLGRQLQVHFLKFEKPDDFTAR